MVYSREDDALIMKCIGHSPTIEKGCEQAAKALNRTFNGVFNRYYRHLKPKFKNTIKTESEIKDSKFINNVTDFRSSNKTQMKITVSNSTNTVASVIYKSDVVTVAKSGDTVIIIENL